MPLLILCGFPASGKTTIGQELEKWFSKDRKVVLVSDSELLKSHGRNRVFKESNIEKEVRGNLRSSVSRFLNNETLVILDSGNYIKGFRYELYCISKEFKTTHCVVEVLVTPEVAKDRNQRKDNDLRYDDDILNALIMRYESPDSRNRWDSPHLAVHQDKIPFDEIASALFNRSAPKPNLSTQSKPVSESSYLTIVDSETRKVINEILAAQDCNRSEIVISGIKLSLLSPKSAAQFNRLRRQFINFVKMHPPSKQDQVTSSFVQFLNSNLISE